MQMSGDGSMLIYIVAAGGALVVLLVVYRLLKGRGSRAGTETSPVHEPDASRAAAGETTAREEEAETVAPAGADREETEEEPVPAPEQDAEPAEAAGPREEMEPEPAAGAAEAEEAGEPVGGREEPGPEEAREPELVAEAEQPVPVEEGAAEPGPRPWTADDYAAALGRRKDELQAELAELLARRDSAGRSLLEIELRAVTGSLVRGEQGFAEFSAWCGRAADSLASAAGDDEIPGLDRALALLRAADLETAGPALAGLADGNPAVAALADFYAGRLAEERADFGTALEHYRAAMEKEGDDPRFLQAAAAMARELGRFDEARTWLERFFGLAGEAMPGELRSLAQHDLGVVYAHDGRYGEAVELYREALAALGEEHPRRGLLLHSMAETREKMGQYEEAGKLYIQAVKLNAARLGKHHPAVGTTLYKLAGLYEELEEDTKAEPLYRQSLAISRGIFGNDHPEIGTIMNNLAEVYRLQGRYDEAEPLYRESLAIAEKNLGPEHLNVAVTLNNLAELCTATGRADEAAELQERAFVIFQQGSPMDEMMELERDKVDVDELQGQTVAG